MKKILIIILTVAALFAALALQTGAASSTDIEISTEQNSEGNSVIKKENAAEGEKTELDGVLSEEAGTDSTVTGSIVKFITENYTGSSLFTLAITVITYLVYEIRKHKGLSKSIGILNNNAVTVSENSAKAIKEVLEQASSVADTVKGYKDEILSILSEIRSTADEKKSLEATLSNVEKFLGTTKLATIELADEVAQLLVLANIPNSVKDELYARHTAAVKTIAEAEGGEHCDGEKA